MKKRTVSSLLAFIMVFGLASFSPLKALTAETGPTINISSAEAKAGEEVTLSVLFENNPGTSSYGLTMYYNPDKLTFVSASAGEVLADLFLALIISPSEISFNSFNFLGMFESGELLFIVKLRINDGVTDAEIKGEDMYFDYDPAFDGFSVIVGETAGYITIYPEIIQPVIKVICGHKEDPGAVTKQPTAQAEGVMSYRCLVCGELLRAEAIPKLPAGNSVTVNGVLISFEVVGGAAVLRPSNDQMAGVLKAAGASAVFDLRGYSSVDMYVDAAWFKDVDKSVVFITGRGSCEVKTKSLWNNSGKQRLITVRNNKLDFKNV